MKTRVETQEYIFVREFVRFLASVLLKASKDSGNEDINLIVGNLVSLDQELSLFRKEASNWKVDLLNSNLQKASKDYCFLRVSCNQELGMLSQV